MVEGWDVNNEMIHGSFFVDQSGDPGIRVEMFQRAAERSPELLLFVNDYNIIAGTEADTYTSLIQDLLDQGAPVSAIGVQVRHSGIYDNDNDNDRLNYICSGPLRWHHDQH